MPIVDKLKEALKPGRKDTGDEADLNKLLASSAKKVLLQKIEFEPASKGFSYQLDSLKTKYVILNPRNEAAAAQKSPCESAQIKRQGESRVAVVLARPASGMSPYVPRVSSRWRPSRDCVFFSSRRSLGERERRPE